jgi:hypothetical protein
MKMEEPSENRLPSGTIVPNRSNNAAVHAGKVMSMAIAMAPPTIVPMSLGICLFMECLPNALLSRSRRRPSGEQPGEQRISQRYSKRKARRLSAPAEG